MTGQLFVVPAGARRGPVRPPGPRARRRPRAALPRHPQVRPDRAVRPRPGHRRARHRGRRRGDVRAASGPSRSTRRSRCATSAAGIRRRTGRLKPLLLDQSFLAGVGNIYADEALWRRGSTRCGPSATLRPPDERRLYRGRPHDPRGGRRAARHLDRRLHGARRRRLDAGAPARLPAHRRAVPALRPADPADRDRGAEHPFLLVVPAAAAGATGRARRRSCAASPAAGAGTRAALDGADRSGPSSAAATRRAAARRAAGATPGPCGGRLMSILRLDAVTREVGTFVILDEIDAAIALGDRIGLVGPNGAGKTTLLRLSSGRDEPDGGEVPRKRGLTHRAARPGGALRRGLHGRRRTSGRPSAPARRTSSGWPRRWPRSSATAAPVSTRTPTSSTSSRCWAATRSTSASTRRCRGLGFATRRVGEAAGGAVGRRADARRAGPPRDRRPGPAAARRAHEPPRPRRPRVARGAPPAARAGRCSSPRTTGRSSTRP